MKPFEVFKIIAFMAFLFLSFLIGLKVSENKTSNQPKIIKSKIEYRYEDMMSSFELGYKMGELAQLQLKNKLTGDPTDIDKIQKELNEHYKRDSIAVSKIWKP